MDLAFEVMVGIGLSAACGFRIFIPMLGLSIAAISGHIELAEGFHWLGTWSALFVFITAACIEVFAYYIPFVDNLLDSIATPSAIIAGTIATSSIITEVSPLLQWSLALIAGGGVSGVIQFGTTVVRGISSSTTGGLGNPLISLAELMGSLITTFLAIVLPIVCMILITIVFFYLFNTLKVKSIKSM